MVYGVWINTLLLFLVDRHNLFNYIQVFIFCNCFAVVLCDQISKNFYLKMFYIIRLCYIGKILCLFGYLFSIIWY